MSLAPEPSVPEPTPDPAAPWPAWTAPTALVGAFVSANVIGVLIFAISGGDPSNPPAAANIAATLVLDACLVGTALVFARLGGRLTPGRFGLRLTPLGRAIGLMVLAYVSFTVFLYAWVSALDIHEKQKILHDLGADRSQIAFAATAVLVTVVAPICEELFFRGFFFTALRGWMGLWPAAAVTGLCFGAVHAGGSPIGYLVPLAVFGFVLCVLYVRTGSLLPCMALHAINNSLALGSSKGWGWQIPLLMFGAIAVIMAIMVPIALRDRTPRLRAA